MLLRVSWVRVDMGTVVDILYEAIHINSYTHFYRASTTSRFGGLPYKMQQQQQQQDSVKLTPDQWTSFNTNHNLRTVMLFTKDQQCHFAHTRSLTSGIHILTTFDNIQFPTGRDMKSSSFSARSTYDAFSVHNDYTVSVSEDTIKKHYPSVDTRVDVDAVVFNKELVSTDTSQTAEKRLVHMLQRYRYIVSKSPVKIAILFGEFIVYIDNTGNIHVIKHHNEIATHMTIMMCIPFSMMVYYKSNIHDMIGDIHDQFIRIVISNALSTIATIKKISYSWGSTAIATKFQDVQNMVDMFKQLQVYIRNVSLSLDETRDASLQSVERIQTYKTTVAMEQHKTRVNQLNQCREEMLQTQNKMMHILYNDLCIVDEKLFEAVVLCDHLRKLDSLD
jgi:hypothetical protein